MAAFSHSMRQHDRQLLVTIPLALLRDSTMVGWEIN